MAACGNPKLASNWVMGELLRTLKERGVPVAQVPLTPERLGGLVRLVGQGTISTSIAKDVFGKIFDSGRTADDVVSAEGLAQVGDADALAVLAREVIAQNADAVAQYRAGKTQTFGFLVGQLMKASRGKANPKMASQLLKAELDAAV